MPGRSGADRRMPTGRPLHGATASDPSRTARGHVVLDELVGAGHRRAAAAADEEALMAHDVAAHREGLVVVLRGGARGSGPRQQRCAAGPGRASGWADVRRRPRHDSLHDYDSGTSGRFRVQHTPCAEAPRPHHRTRRGQRWRGLRKMSPARPRARASAGAPHPTGCAGARARLTKMPR